MRTTRRERIVPLLFAIAFFILFGEEISWGQRLLGFETPVALKGVNIQDEFNLHNLGGYAADHIFIAGVFFYGGVMPLLASWSVPLHNLCLRWGLPPGFLQPMVAINNIEHIG